MGTRAAWLHAARVATLVFGAACAAGDGRAESVPAGRGTGDYVIDSILPPEEELRRFRAGLPAPAALEGGATSREALVRRFMDRLAARDTAALRAMTLTRAEFAHLVYPGSMYTRPPYRTPPGLVWLQLTHATGKGLRRLMRADAVTGTYDGHTCHEPPVRDGRARLWRGCRVALRSDAPQGPVQARLFGVIVEVDGRLKFASLETDF